MCPLTISTKQLVGGHDLTCALHLVMALQNESAKQMEGRKTYRKREMRRGPYKNTECKQEQNSYLLRVSVSMARGAKKHFMDCFPSPFAHHPPPLPISLREGSLSSMVFFMISAANPVCIWSSQSRTCSGSRGNRNVVHMHTSEGQGTHTSPSTWVYMFTQPKCTLRISTPNR